MGARPHFNITLGECKDRKKKKELRGYLNRPPLRVNTRAAVPHRRGTGLALPGGAGDAPGRRRGGDRPPASSAEPEALARGELLPAPRHGLRTRLPGTGSPSCGPGSCRGPVSPAGEPGLCDEATTTRGAAAGGVTCHARELLARDHPPPRLLDTSTPSSSTHARGDNRRFRLVLTRRLRNPLSTAAHNLPKHREGPGKDRRLVPTQLNCLGSPARAQQLPQTASPVQPQPGRCTRSHSLGARGCCRRGAVTVGQEDQSPETPFPTTTPHL